METDTVLRLSPVASFQRLGEGAVVLRLDSGQLYSANATTEAFLAAVDGRRTLAEIVDLILADYEVERAVLERDMRAMADRLMANGIVEPAGARV